jgi:hypothetical protein
MQSDNSIAPHRIFGRHDRAQILDLPIGHSLVEGDKKVIRQRVVVMDQGWGETGVFCHSPCADRCISFVAHHLLSCIEDELASNFRFSSHAPRLLSGLFFRGMQCGIGHGVDAPIPPY